MICPVEKSKTINIENYGDINVLSNGDIYGKNGKFKEHNSSKGYKMINIKSHNYYIHRLVAEAWIPNPENKPQVNHINGDKTKNYVSNLEWVTNQENRIHAVKNDLSSATITYEESKQIRNLYSTGFFTYEDLAYVYNVSYSNIGYIVRNDSWNY